MRGFLLVGVLLSASALAGAPRAAASRVVLRAGRTEVMLAPGAAVVARASVRDLTADFRDGTLAARCRWATGRFCASATAPSTA